MPLVYTSDDILASARNRGAAGDTGSLGWTDADLLRYATEILWLKICPTLMRLREEYFAMSTRLATSPNTSRYRLPSRALAQKLRNIFHVEASGDRRRIDPVPVETLELYNDSSNTPAGYYLEGSDIVLVPSASGISGSIEFSFYFRPGSLVLTSAARQVTAVVSPTVLEVGSAFPAAFTTSKLYDVHSQESGAEVKSFDLAATTIASSAPFRITFSTAVDGSVFGTRAAKVGDWICLAEEAVIPGCPKEWHPLLCEAMGATISAGAGDIDLAKHQLQEFAADRKGLLDVHEGRVESKPLRITGRRGLLGGRRG